MKNAENITIVLMLTTAAILGAMLVGTYFGTSQSAGGDVFARHMGFIVCTGKVAAYTDAIYMIDSETKNLNAYVFDDKTNAIQFLTTVNLEKAFR